MHDSTSWYPSEADDQGWVKYTELRKAAETLSLERFVLAYPRPALIVQLPDEAVASDDAPGESGVQLLTMMVSGGGIIRYLSRVAFVCKRPGKPFAHLIAIGRSSSNDISMTVESLSKVHGYLVPEADGSTRYTDHGSTNGSHLNGQRLAPKSKALLSDGDRLQLGLEVVLDYLEPASLHRRLTST
ncbi:MAG: FHA domain-containing protein [Acidobacteriota bacterium]